MIDIQRKTLEKVEILPNTGASFRGDIQGPKTDW